MTPCGQRPLDVGRFAGVAGILPVDVPAGFELEVEASIVGSAGMKLRLGADELHVHMRQVGGTGSRETRQAAASRTDEREDRAEKSHQN